MEPLPAPPRPPLPLPKPCSATELVVEAAAVVVAVRGAALAEVMGGVVSAGDPGTPRAPVRWAGEAVGVAGVRGGVARGIGGVFRGAVSCVPPSFILILSPEKPRGPGYLRLPPSSHLTLPGSSDGAVAQLPLGGTPEAGGTPPAAALGSGRLSLLSSFLTSEEHILSGDDGTDLELLLAASSTPERGSPSRFLSGSSLLLIACRLCFMRRFWNHTFTCGK